MALFRLFDPFFIAQGSHTIVVGAPHHGTRPNVDADKATGPIARELAKQLDARQVIVSDMRHTVDVNKNPLGIKKSVRRHALRYQNEIFRGLPSLVIEIHGHVSGQYPIELTSGFELDPAFPGDAMFLERLQKIKQSLPGLLAGKLGQSYSVGIYPIDRDVKKTATNTYTFQKIRRARNRVGMEMYGLHIELAAELRTSKQAKAPGYINALTEVFASAIRAAFIPLPNTEANIPTHVDLADDAPVSRTTLRVARAPEDSANRYIALLHPDEVNTLGLLDGDLITLSNHGEQLRLPASSSSLVHRNHIAIPARIRHQLDLNPGDSAAILQDSRTGSADASTNYQSFIVGGTRAQKTSQLWIHPHGMQRLHAGPKTGLRVKGPFPSSEPVTALPVSDNDLYERVVVLSDTLMQKLTLTLGDVLMIEAAV